jgi:hypothetical protein
MGIITLFGLKVYVVFSKVASCNFMWLGNVTLLNNKRTKLKMLSLFDSKIGMVSIIRSSLGSATPPLLLLVWNLGVMTQLRMYGTCLLLDMLDANQGAGHVDHTLGNGAEFAQDPLSLPSGPITRLRAKRFKEALNGLIQENWADSKKTKMGSNNNQGLVHLIKAIEEAN